MPYRLYLCLAHSIPSPLMLMQYMHRLYYKWYDPLHIITWPCWFIDLDLTYCSLLPLSIGAKSCSSFTAMWPITPKPPTCSSHLQPFYQAKSCLDFLHRNHMTMSCIRCNELLHHMYKPCNKSKPSLLSWHELFTQVYLWTNHLCISHLNTY
jgi:hypothetical protein